MAKLNSGDEVVFFDECYHRSREFCLKHMSRFGVVTRQVKACDYDAMEAAKPGSGGLFSVAIDPWKCSGCLECIDVCGPGALREQHQDAALLDTLAVQGTTDDVVADAGEVLHAAPADEHHRVLLKVVTHARDVARDLEAVREPDARHLAERRVRLLRGLGEHAHAHAALLRAVLQRRALRLGDDLLATGTHKLTDSRHTDFARPPEAPPPKQHQKTNVQTTKNLRGRRSLQAWKPRTAWRLEAGYPMVVVSRATDGLSGLPGSFTVRPLRSPVTAWEPGPKCRHFLRAPSAASGIPGQRAEGMKLDRVS